MVHRDETGAGRLLAAYSALGIPGTPAAVSAAAPRDTHQFVAALPPASGVSGPWGSAHSSVVVDRLTPRAATGGPAYAAVWDAMIGP
jgi:hypothetical protein